MVFNSSAYLKGKGALKQFIKGYLRDQWWRIYGSKFENPDLPQKPKSLVFICKGNICRSPFAAHVARNLVSSEKRLKILSAGLVVGKPESPPDLAILAAKNFGVDLSSHKSERFDSGCVSDGDMVVAMEAKQLIKLKEILVGKGSKAYLLPMFDPMPEAKIKGYQKFNIPDPYAKDLKIFKQCYLRIERCVGNLLGQIYQS